MAGASTIKLSNLETLLEMLSLRKYFPSKLSRVHMYQITEESLNDCPPINAGSVGWYFLRKMTQYNYQGRNVSFSFNRPTKEGDKTSKQKSRLRKRERADEEIAVHPLDVLLVMFLCCDPLCQQDLVTQLWACRLAVPFACPDLGQKSEVFLWPWRGIVMRWDVLIEGKKESRERQIASHPMRSIGFIRLGEPEFSKSDLINGLISGSEKSHPMFFNRNSKGSTKNKYIAHGLLEVGFFFPKGKPDEFCQDCVRLVNLRGDARQHKRQVELLQHMVGTIVIICNSSEFLKSKSLIQESVDGGTSVLVMVTDKSVSSEVEDKIVTFLEELGLPEEEVETVLIEDKKAELFDETKKALNGVKKGKMISLEDVTIACEKLHISVDEQNEICIVTRKMADEMVKMIESEGKGTEKKKDVLLPLQGSLWTKWTKADKEIHRLKELEKTMDPTTYREEKEAEKANARAQQVELIRNRLPRHISYFIDALINNDDQTVLFFLRWLKLKIDAKSREELLPLFKRYKANMQNLSDADDRKRTEINSNLEKLDEEMNQKSFGLEHLTREIAQIYEALEAANLDARAVFKQQPDLPEVAANLLLNGYPLEILDGDVSAVPLTWIKAVFHAVASKICLQEGNDPSRIYVLSVLGIQSSGKSTFLNTLFGLQFAVSAGRCTRGVFCQLVKIEENLREKLQIDYIIAVDTEGLRSPELSSKSSRSHDNELSTFVIGLGDITLINLMGENTSYLEEFLPISVHAFLRMGEVGLHPKSAIVHQNVDKSNAEKLVQQGRVLENILDKLTRVACEFEKKEVKQFKEIIDFDINIDIDHMPGLLEGELPMAPVSIAYSDEATKIRKKLLVTAGIQNQQPLMEDDVDMDNKFENVVHRNTLQNFPAHIDKLWNAIKKDDFVYEFKNTIETEARGKLDRELCGINMEFRQVAKQLISEGYTKLSNCNSETDLDNTKRDHLSNVQSEVAQEYSKHQTHLQEFYSKAEKVYEEALASWKSEADQYIRRLSTDLGSEIKDQIEVFQKDQMRRLKIKEAKTTQKETMAGYIRRFVEKKKAQTREHMLKMTDTQLAKEFEKQWSQWVNEVAVKYPRSVRTIDVQSDMFGALLETFQSYKPDILKKIYSKKQLRNYHLHDFVANAQHVTTSVTSKIKKVFGLGPDVKAEVNKRKSDLFHKATEMIQSMINKREPYNQSMGVAVISLLRDEETKKNENSTIQFTKEFYIDVYVCVCGEAIRELEAMHNNMEAEQNPKQIMNGSKTEFLGLFKTCFDQTNQLGYIASVFVSAIWKGFNEKIGHDFGTEVVREMTTRTHINILNSKKSFLAYVLKELLEGNDFRSLHSYIKWPSDSIKSHARAVVKEFWDTSHPKDGTEGKALARSMVDKLYAVVLGTLKETRTAVEARSLRSFSDWKSVFLLRSKDKFILRDFELLSSPSELEKLDLKAFLDAFEQQLNTECAKNKIKRMRELESNKNRFCEQAACQIINSIVGCTEKCPFCKEICDHMVVNHDGKHETKFHRPQGISGYHHSETEKLVVETCTYDVGSNDTFHSRKSKRVVKYADYSSVFPDWKIMPDTSLESDSLWKWVFVHYLDDLVNVYDLKKPDNVPKSWETLDVVNEIEKLKKYL